MLAAVVAGWAGVVFVAVHRLSLSSTPVISRVEIQPSDSAFLVASPRDPRPILG